jgi:hypothetical protein
MQITNTAISKMILEPNRCSIRKAYGIWRRGLDLRVRQSCAAAVDGGHLQDDAERTGETEENAGVLHFCNSQHEMQSL